jgi:hypothetical protein
MGGSYGSTLLTTNEHQVDFRFCVKEADVDHASALNFMAADEASSQPLVQQ